MSLTVAAVLFVALVLPGVAALAAFYNGINTSEVRVTPPPMGALSSVAAIGIAAVLSHLCLSALLLINDCLPDLIDLPPANPYALVLAPSGADLSPDRLFAGFFGLALSVVIGSVIGFSATSGNWEWRNQLIFGWLYPIIKKARPTENYINAYVLSTIEHDRDVLGYEGTVEHVALNQQFAITAVTLVNVSTFYLRLRPGGAERIEAGSRLLHLALREGDFKNIALVVLRDTRASAPAKHGLGQSAAVSKHKTVAPGICQRQRDPASRDDA